MVEAIFIGTIIPLLFMLGLLRHSRPVFGCFCWGAVAFLLIYLLSPPLYRLLGLESEFAFTATVTGPLLEEMLKSLLVIVIAIFAPRSMIPFLYILGLASGMGFAIEENLVYLLLHFESAEQSRLLMVLRSLSTCLMHGVATGLIGYALTWARRRSGWERPAIPVLGIAVASAYHAGFNWTMIEGHTTVALLAAFVLFVAFLCLMKQTEGAAPETKGTTWE